jgi:hypothetical protein
MQYMQDGYSQIFLRCRQREVEVEKQQSALEAVLEQKASNEKLQARLNFLRQPFDNQNVNGAMKSDVSILVQDAEDERLHAHKFILVSVHQVIALKLIRIYKRFSFTSFGCCVLPLFHLVKLY